MTASAAKTETETEKPDSATVAAGIDSEKKPRSSKDSTDSEKSPRSSRPPADSENKDPRKPKVHALCSTLRLAVADIAAGISARSEIAILSCLRMEVVDPGTATGGRIAMLGTDLDQWVARECEGEPAPDKDAKHRGFALCLPAKQLGKVLNEFAGETVLSIEVESEPGTALERVIIAGEGARFTLNALPVDDFPHPQPFTHHASFALPCVALADGFAAVSHAISTEETRYYLNGIFAHWHEELEAFRLVATDGHRLALRRLDTVGGMAEFPDVIIARHTVQLLDRLLSEAIKAAEVAKRSSSGGGSADNVPEILVEISAAGPGALLRFQLPAADGSEVVITAKSVDGHFPDYQNVIPSAHERSAIIPRAALAVAVKRVGVMVEDKSRAVAAEFTAGKVTLSVTDPGLGTAREEVGCTFEGEDLRIGFNRDFWRQALAALPGDEISVWLGDAGSPALLLPSGVNADETRIAQVLMPMLVSLS